MANILVTGANGQLGMEFRKLGFTALDEVFYTDVAELDITDYDAVEDFVVEHEIDTIINCAAYTAVDKAEEEIELAEKINVKAVDNLAKVAAQEDCLLIHISTDYVFDGTATEPYSEKSKPSPVSVYGKTKWKGEQAVIKSGCIYLIIRTAWLYSVYGNNFVKTMLRLADEREEVRVVADQVGAPTYAEDLARTILAILEDDALIEYEGIFHFTNQESCSWCEFAQEIMKLGGKSCRVTPITTAEYPTKAIRPAYSVLDTTKIRETFSVEIPTWKSALSRMIEELQIVKE